MKSNGNYPAWRCGSVRSESGNRHRASRHTPAVVVQIDRANAVSPHTIIVPFTTKIRRALLPSHALVPAGAGGLSRDSVALCEQIRVIDKRRVIRVLGHLDDPHLGEIGNALGTILGL